MMSDERDLLQHDKQSKLITADITDITVHHSAGNANETLNDIALWHINGRNWPGIAYHFVIDKDGTIFQTNQIGAYTFHNGFNNRGAIGICLQGNFETGYPDSKQIYALTYLVNDLKKRYPQIKFLMGHREYQNETLCPGKNLNMDMLRSATGLKYNPKGATIHKSYPAEQYTTGNESDN
jgi:N-acetyl-anhydromuramyl-L-alanine amidase AmpD